MSISTRTLVALLLSASVACDGGSGSNGGDRTSRPVSLDDTGAADTGGADTGSAPEPEPEGEEEERTCGGSPVSVRSVVDVEDGFAAVTVHVDEGTRSLQLVSEADDSDLYVMVERVYDPSGEVVLDYTDFHHSSGPFELYTAAVVPWKSTNVLNWPVSAEDAPLAPGDWTVTLYAMEADGQWADATVAVEAWQVSDDDPSAGCVPVRVVLSSDVAGDPALVRAVEGAWDVAADIWAAAGVELILAETVESALGREVPAPSDGSEAYRSLSAVEEEAMLTLVVGEGIDSDTAGLLGQSGGIPGSLSASPHAVVALGWLMHAGSDGQLSGDEIDMMGATIAHELGHYAGLAHPVQFDEHYDVVGFDGLPDTEECGDVHACMDVLSDNLMFPYMTCGGSGCQDDLSDDQASVLNLFTGTR